ncbi:hypothetical protein L0B53_12635 [Vibrio sp. SS-MA-C1-2]|uniref:hypothetical protein n=1 Tax=Vibrio sp. SS-MA-C1-2 TaxID=2908646 RepID=UPI001F1AA25F|nr:hypothetical protein [Vibrio sp. SS-MA-C1-2]UJF17871.1 hypothetical protein L0B53_12635 [Vibrio sp. SS-MA-C1-2]
MKRDIQLENEQQNKDEALKDKLTPFYDLDTGEALCYFDPYPTLLDEYMKNHQ